MEPSKEYLQDAYHVRELSIRDMAKECDTYPNKIRRALIKEGVRRLTKSEAQTRALRLGRHQHPTKGRKRTELVKVKISEGVAKAWENMDEQERERRVLLAKQQ